MRTRLLVLACSLMMTGSAFAADIFRADLYAPWKQSSTVFLTDEVIPECPAPYFAMRLEVENGVNRIDCWTFEAGRVKVLDRTTGKIIYSNPDNFRKVRP